jgi:hypothetical protein
MGYVESDREINGNVGIDEYGAYVFANKEKYYLVNYLQSPSEELEIIGNSHDTEVQP